MRRLWVKINSTREDNILAASSFSGDVRVCFQLTGIMPQVIVCNSINIANRGSRSTSVVHGGADGRGPALEATVTVGNL